MTNSKLVVAALAVLGLSAGKAYGQDDPCGGGGDEGMGNPCGGEGGEGGGEATAPETTAAPSEDGAAMAGDYPQAVDDRPRVLPKGMLEVAGALGLTNISDLIALDIGARYGLAPKIDAAVDYAFALKDFEIKGSLGAAVQYGLSESEKMGMAVKVTTGLNLNGIDAATGDSKVEFEGIGLGVNLIYRLTPKISVQSGGDQLTIGFSDGVKPIALSLPVAFGYQVNEKINAYVETNIADIGLSPSGNALIGADRTPLTVGGTFSPSNKLDVGAAFHTGNLEDTADFYDIILMGAMRM